jgi:hypothetical protein
MMTDDNVIHHNVTTDQQDIKGFHLAMGILCNDRKVMDIMRKWSVETF